MDANTTNTKCRIRFLRCSDNGLKCRHWFICARVQRACDNRATYRLCISLRLLTLKGAKNLDIACSLFIFTRKRACASKEKLGSQQPDTLGSPLPRRLCLNHASYIGEERDMFSIKDKGFLMSIRLSCYTLLLMSGHTLCQRCAKLCRGMKVQ